MSLEVIVSASGYSILQDGLSVLLQAKPVAGHRHCCSAMQDGLAAPPEEELLEDPDVQNDLSFSAMFDSMHLEEDGSLGPASRLQSRGPAPWQVCRWLPMHMLLCRM